MSIFADYPVEQHLEQEKETFVRFWKKLAELESPSSDKERVDKAGNFVVDFAKGLGFPARKKHFEKSGDGIVIEYGDCAAKAPILLSGHLDTVYAFGEFGENPVRLENGILYGPGVLDCKAGIAMALLVMDTLRQAGYDRHPIKLVLPPDEEVSNRFSGEEGKEFLRGEAKGSLCAFNLECGYVDKFTVSRFGILRRKIRVHGVAAHAGAAYDKGRSAIKEAAHKIIRIESNSDLERMTFNCGTITGGTVDNVVPEWCEFGIDIRIKTEKDGRIADEILKNEAANSTVPDTTAEVIEISTRPTMLFCDKIGKLAEIYRDVFEKQTGRRLNYFHTRGGSDAAYFSQAGVPVIDSIAPEGGFFHTHKEFADTNTLVPRAMALIGTIDRLDDSFRPI